MKIGHKKTKAHKKCGDWWTHPLLL
jgi:hypothetical protein